MADAVALEKLREAKRSGVRVVLEVEDNLFARERPQQVVRRSTDPLSWSIFGPPKAMIDAADAELLSLHREALDVADALIVSTAASASAYAHLHSEIHVVPNAVDPPTWPAYEKPADGIFRIGLFATPSHGDDLELVADALRWASTYPRVEVIVCGIEPRMMTWREFRDGWANYSEPVVERVKRWRFPFKQLPITCDYDAYRRTLMQLDVGLCPIVENDFSRCRSDSKALEYAMAGALPLCSDAEPYRTWKWPECPLVPDAQGFLDRVAWTVENRDATRVIAQDWRESVLRERTIAGTIDKWRAAVAA